MKEQGGCCSRQHASSSTVTRCRENVDMSLRTRLALSAGMILDVAFCDFQGCLLAEATASKQATFVGRWWC